MQGRESNKSISSQAKLAAVEPAVLGRMRGKVVCTCLGSIDRIGGNLNARTLMQMFISPGISVAATRACNRSAGHLQSILASPFVEPCRNPTKGIERRSKLVSKKKKAHAFNWSIKSPAGAQRILLFSSVGVHSRINLRSISP